MRDIDLYGLITDRADALDGLKGPFKSYPGFFGALREEVAEVEQAIYQDDGSDADVRREMFDALVVTFRAYRQFVAEAERNGTIEAVRVGAV